MQPKSEQPIFPHVIPKPPEDYKGFNKWAVETSGIINEINKQLFNLYNRHLSDALAHPAMWKANRTLRHAYRNDTSNGVVIEFPASVINPVYLITGETRQVNPPGGYKLYISSSTLNCDFSTNGVGGLDTGTIAADSVYYLYAVVAAPNQTQIGIIGSLNDPSVGPTGYNYGEWMYQGAVATFEADPSFPKFAASQGIFISEDIIEQKTFSGAGLTTVTFNGLPVTATDAYFQAFVTSTTGAAIIVNQGALTQTCFANAFKNYIGPSFLMVRDPATWDVALTAGDGAVMFNGWIEDPSKWS